MDWCCGRRCKGRPWSLSEFVLVGGKIRILRQVVRRREGNCPWRKLRTLSHPGLRSSWSRHPPDTGKDPADHRHCGRWCLRLSYRFRSLHCCRMSRNQQCRGPAALWLTLKSRRHPLKIAGLWLLFHVLWLLAHLLLSACIHASEKCCRYTATGLMNNARRLAAFCHIWLWLLSTNRTTSAPAPAVEQGQDSRNRVPASRGERGTLRPIARKLIYW